MANDNTLSIDGGMQEMLPIGAKLMGGHYRVVRYLASGGFGNTYLAVDENFDEQVVIKEFFLKGVTGRIGDSVTVTLDVNRPLFDSQLNKFIKEARRLRKLDHVNVVRVYDLFQENDTAYYVMDFIDGESLAERVKRDGALSEEQVRLYLPQLLDALETVHNNGILHLDLKPGNIMADKNGRLRLIDFGASKQTSADGNATTSTGLAYTPGFAALEQMHGQLDRVGAWTDLYALGATLYHLLTAQRPPDAIDIDYSPEDAFHFPYGVSPSMCGFVKWLMQPNYRKRPQAVAAVRMHLPEREPQSSAFATQMKPAVGYTTQQHRPLQHLVDEQTEMIKPEVSKPSSNPERSENNWISVIFIIILAFLFMASFFGIKFCSGSTVEESGWESASASASAPVESVAPSYSGSAEWSGPWSAVEESYWEEASE